MYCRDVDYETGELTFVEPEFARMSRRPGIGYDWYRKFRHDTYKDDSVVIRGKKMLPPNYYTKKLSDECPADFERVSRKRKAHISETELAQLRVREVNTKSRVDLYKRKI